MHEGMRVVRTNVLGGTAGLVRQGGEGDVHGCPLARPGCHRPACFAWSSRIPERPRLAARGAHMVREVSRLGGRGERNRDVMLRGFNLLPQTFFCASVTSSNQRDVEMHQREPGMSKCTCLYSSLFLLYSWFFCISSVSVFLGFSLNAPGSQRGQLKRSVMRHRLCVFFFFLSPLHFLERPGRPFKTKEVQGCA